MRVYLNWIETLATNQEVGGSSPSTRTTSPCSPTGRGTALKTRELGVRSPSRAQAKPGRSRFLRVAPEVVPVPYRTGTGSFLAVAARLVGHHVANVKSAGSSPVYRSEVPILARNPSRTGRSEHDGRRLQVQRLRAFGEQPADSEASYLGAGLAIRGAGDSDCLFLPIHGSLAQLVAQQTLNLTVLGSNPRRSTHTLHVAGTA